MEPIILIVEDSKMFGQLLERSIINSLGFKTVWCETFLEADEYLQSEEIITLALLDYCLPDAMDGEIIDLCLEKNIPSVIITGNYSDDLQELVWKKRVIDYVVKEGPHTIEYILDLIERIVNNRNIGILVVDNSKLSRKNIHNELEPFRFKLYMAENGLEALDILDKNNDIKLVLTEYKMPSCDGLELTKRIRKSYLMDKLAIIGLSSSSSHQLTIKFIKYGANDFLTKPFNREMLYCRINQNLRIVEHFDTLREISLIDHLTNVNNRRYLLEAGDIIFENSRQEEKPPVVAILDIDNFREINNQYGHEVGDRVIKIIAENLNCNILKSDIISRYGGDSFCIICRKISSENAINKFNDLRDLIGNIDFKTADESFKITISIGLCLTKTDSFIQMLHKADEMLNKAKEDGRNRVKW